MTPEQLQDALAQCEDVEDADVAGLLASGEPRARMQANLALVRTHVRRALIRAVDLAKEQRYTDQATLAAIEKLAALSDVEEPYLELLKQLGIEAARAGQLDRAMNLFQTTLNRAVAAGQRRDRRSGACMRFLYDREIGEAVMLLARALPGPPPRERPQQPYRLVALCSALQDEDGPSIVTLKRTQLLREFGFEVEVVSTELAASLGSSMLHKLEQGGIAFSPVPAGTWHQRIQWLIQYFTLHPADAVVYEASGADYLAQLAASVSMARVQVWDNKAFEPQAGRYDIVAQALTPEQIRYSRWPQAAKFYGTPIAIADEIDAAAGYTHEELGVPADAVVLATFGRMEKCVPDAYLHSLTQILRQEPTAWLVLAGSDALNQMGAILGHFSAGGVGDRVRYLGRRQQDAPRLVKSIDVYCDTHPWTGGQSLLDAMQAGAPVVAMHKPVASSLDPHGVAPSAVADVMLSGIVELAQPGDVAGYVRIARALIADPQLRRSNGAKMHERAVHCCSMRKSTFAIAQDVAALIEGRSIDRPGTDG